MDSRQLCINSFHPRRGLAAEIALVLAMLTKVEDPSEEIIVGAIQCLQVLALDLGVTAEQTKLVQDLLLHFVYKPAGQCYMDYM